MRDRHILRDRLILIPALLTLAAAFQSCSGEDVLQVADGGPVPVSPSVKVEEDITAPAGTGGFADGEDAFRLCAFLLSADEGEPSDWTVKPKTEAFENEPADVKGGVPTLRNPKYYPPHVSGRKLRFHAYAPATNGTYNNGNGENPPTVDYTITGQEDIMTATVTQPDDGIGGAAPGEKQQQPSFRFHHLLKRVTFKLVKGEGFASNINASTIRIADCRTKARLDVVTGELAFEGEATGHVQMTGTWTIKPPEEALELPNVHLLCELGKDLTVEVVVAGVTYHAELELTSTDPDTEAGAAGVSHLVTLTFKGTEVDATGSIVPWEDVGSADGVIR